VQYFPEKPFYIMGIVRPSRQHSAESDYRLGEEIVRGLKFTGECLITVLRDRDGELERRLTQIPDSEIYRADNSAASAGR